MLYVKSYIKIHRHMIEFNSISKQTPYLIFIDLYQKALNLEQKNIEAICIASYSPESSEVNARFVNLKFVNDNEFIFFSNYKSPKSQDFRSHQQITGLIYWNSINVQVRIKAYIKKTNKEFNSSYFAKRDRRKNALAISSDQSKTISSYTDVQKNFKRSLEKDNLTQCPEYWGGFSFTPYYFEFWEGHESRLNKRETYELQSNEWIHSLLQP